MQPYIKYTEQAWWSVTQSKCGDYSHRVLKIFNSVDCSITNLAQHPTAAITIINNYETDHLQMTLSSSSLHTGCTSCHPNV